MRQGRRSLQPEELSEKVLRRITCRYVADLGDNIGPYVDIPAPDVQTMPVPWPCL